MKKFIIGTLLFIIALVGFIPLAIWGFIEILVELFYKKKFWKALGKLGDIILMFATIIDVALNVICQVPLNRFFQSGGYKFGNRRDTISRVLGINQYDGTLTSSGNKLRQILDVVETDHCLKSI